MSTPTDPTFLNRRTLARAAAAGLAAGMLPSAPAAAPAPTPAAEPAAGEGPDLTVDELTVFPVRLPFRPVPERNMARELPHWAYFEVVRVRLKSGHFGHGDTMSFYTWGRTDEADLRRAKGQNAAALMWDDTLGAGLQTALFDAVGRALNVPVHRLLGSQVRDRAALSWWAIDMPPEDWAAECTEALKLGYTAFKTKGRPWYDIRAQVKAVAEVTPRSFKLDMDFNDTLLDAARAIPILKELEETPQIGIYETPIPQRDVKGNQQIREVVETPIAMHYGTPRALLAITEKVCDGFVIGGGARTVVEQGNVAAMAHMPFWLQLVGSGITAAFALHLAAVLRSATWPAVNCHQLFTHTLLTRPIVVSDGTSPVPDAPGLGYDVDPAALEKFRVDFPKSRPEPERLVEVSWPNGKKMFIASDGQVNFVLRQGMSGAVPYFQAGANTRLVPNDGSPLWRERYDRARQKSFIEG
ncbi:MAG: mandelate racemase/muconate lactonizing enzyme family protein [Isosphaeraceae bacterium]